MDVSTKYNEVGTINIHGIPEQAIAELAKKFKCYLEHYPVVGETRAFDSFVLKVGETEFKFFS